MMLREMPKVGSMHRAPPGSGAIELLGAMQGVEARELPGAMWGSGAKLFTGETMGATPMPGVGTALRVT